MLRLIPLILLLCTLNLGVVRAAEPGEKPAKFEGLVTPELHVELASPSEGLVTRILAREGEKIEAGSAIAELSSEEEKIRLRLAELQKRKLDEDFSAMGRLYKEKAASRDDYTRAMLSAEQANAEHDLALIRLQNRTIISPTGGYVLRLLKDAGESVQRLERFAEIIRLDQVHVTVYVPSAFLGRVIRGATALVYLNDDAPPLSGEVELADPILDPGGEVFRVKVLVREPGERLQAGTRVQVEFPPQQ
jgi:RND family efflux transporter MFP subunit